MSAIAQLNKKKERWALYGEPGQESLLADMYLSHLSPTTTLSGGMIIMLRELRLTEVRYSDQRHTREW